MHPTPLVFGSAWSSGCSNDQPTPPAPPDRAGGLGTTTHPTQLPIAVPGAGRTTGQVSGLLPLQRVNASSRGPSALWDPPICAGTHQQPHRPPYRPLFGTMPVICAHSRPNPRTAGGTSVALNVPAIYPGPDPWTRIALGRYLSPLDQHTSPKPGGRVV